VGYDAGSVVRSVKEAYKASGLDSEIIVGSIRHLVDVNEAIQAGADIVTVPPKFFPQMCAHPKTDEAVAQFMTEFRAWEQATVQMQQKRAA
jgi:transaldolase